MTSEAETPSRVRALTGPEATALARLAATFDDLQTALRCCEQIVAQISGGRPPSDVVLLEALWTTALLSYARGFCGDAAPLTDEDVRAVVEEKNVVDWHHVLLRLRDHYADEGTNPRELFSAGVAQDAAGAVIGIAVTSTSQPVVDEGTVRRLGALAVSLSTVVDERVGAAQKAMFATMKDATPVELARLPVLEVAAPA